MSNANDIANKPAQAIDLLSLIADDKSVVTYRPRWNRLTGSVAGTILLQQLIYRWISNKRAPFYKFTSPCNHPLCRPGDSWEEELGLSRREFETARGRIAARTQGELAPDALISYWVTTGHCTWYAINEPLLVAKLAALYPEDHSAAVGVQLQLPAEPFDKSANGVGGNVKRHSTNPQMAFDKSANGNAEPFDKSANAIRQIRQQNNKDDLIDYEEQRETQRSTPAAAPDAAEPPVAAAAADPVAAILDWIEFDDALSDKERAALDPPTLLAWAYWVHLSTAQSASRINNPVGLVRAQWRKGKAPRVDLLALARAWLALDDEARARLLGRLEWAVEFSSSDPAALAGDEFEHIPLSTAAAVYIATGGALGPAELSPAAAIPPPLLDPPPDASARWPGPPEIWPLWTAALAELKMQMAQSTFSAWLSGTTAALTGDGLTICVRNEFAVEWLGNRLHPVIQRTVDGLAGRPLVVRYEWGQGDGQ